MGLRALHLWINSKGNVGPDGSGCQREQLTVENMKGTVARG